ncbi:protein-tyrosine sulfotransferase 1 isoform X1 [Dromiciops gliroides]|uniref:protein-tyrosine sulfotransferase 1 isoform X1 n=1 Tax=Dromiciops gliroides TaxID=33562 RepID=UPI001CC65540|nr:protein-tyrosine sulfotransferase 1 isoform X1 [Dromiciops gliroides]XP_043858187.1 protein-tyrosine sulfotransferase 1 isoform X1 [Dromiciops gliroides]XP_043858188.1 protein-tyrosine sulfotransferase 1 isoform X1 [Dromiciops gliroides]
MVGKLKQNLLLACLVISSVTVFYLGQHAMECHHRIEERSQPVRLESVQATPRTANQTATYHKDMPLIFIGGVPRSGTTLMRAMLDAHPDIRCGEETRVIPRILALKQMWSRSSKEKIRLDEAGVTDEVLDSAMQAFLLEIIVKHGEPAPYLCNKDPFALKSLTYLARLFPNAKFLLMVRDGRASVHSMISRKVTIAGFDLNSYRDCLTKWNRAIETMYNQCMEVGYKRCMLVHYEQLVLHPERWMRTLLKFLHIPWNYSVLHHEEMIGKAGGVSLSKVERSTDQVIKPVNVAALSKWVGKIPPDVLQDMAVIAPMLAKLGYDPHANPPSYGKPDPKILENTRRVYKGEFQLPDFLRDKPQNEPGDVEKSGDASVTHKEGILPFQGMGDL